VARDQQRDGISRTRVRDRPRTTGTADRASHLLIAVRLAARDRLQMRPHATLERRAGPQLERDVRRRPVAAPRLQAIHEGGGPAELRIPAQLGASRIREDRTKRPLEGSGIVPEAEVTHPALSGRNEHVTETAGCDDVTDGRNGGKRSGRHRISPRGRWCRPNLRLGAIDRWPDPAIDPGVEMSDSG
jgi:hypothetical protein